MAKDMYQKRKEKRVSKSDTQDGCQKNVINWFPGHMAKTKREIKEKLKLVDIVFEMIDARIPFSSRNPELKKIINDKPYLVVLSKSSLANQTQTIKWMNYFESKGEHCLAIDSITNDNINKILKSSLDILKDKIKKQEEKGLKKKAIRVLIMGIPNSGKSTLINTLSKRKKATTGNLPGVTRTNSWIKVSDELEIMDTPGILWPKIENQKCALNLALAGSIKDAILPLDDLCTYGFGFLDKNYQVAFKEKYDLAEYSLDDIESIYTQIAKKRGCYKNGKIDYERINKLFLNDLRSGKFGGVSFDIYDEFISL